MARSYLLTMQSSRKGLFGGAARFYLLPRISVGPEIAYVHGENHSHLMLTGNVTFDFVRPVNRQPRPITPFVVAGGGVFQTREMFSGDGFPNDEVFTSSDGAFTACGGVRARVGRYLFVGGEARIGWKLHIRLNGMVGVPLGNRTVGGSPKPHHLALVERVVLRYCVRSAGCSL